METKTGTRGMSSLRLLCVVSYLATAILAQEHTGLLGLVKTHTGLLDLGLNLLHQAAAKVVSKIESTLSGTDRYNDVPKNDYDSVPYKKKCISDTEKIDVCSPKGKTVELLVCLSNAKLANGYYATSYTRQVNFPPYSFDVSPNVTLTIKSWGKMIYGGIQVRADKVSATGFSLVVAGGQPVPPYDLKVKWYACVIEEPSPYSGDYTEPIAADEEPAHQ